MALVDVSVVRYRNPTKVTDIVFESSIRNTPWCSVSLADLCESTLIKFLYLPVYDRSISLARSL